MVEQFLPDGTKIDWDKHGFSDIERQCALNIVDGPNFAFLEELTGRNVMDEWYFLMGGKIPNRKDLSEEEIRRNLELEFSSNHDRRLVRGRGEAVRFYVFSERDQVSIPVSVEHGTAYFFGKAETGGIRPEGIEVGYSICSFEGKNLTHFGIDFGMFITELYNFPGMEAVDNTMSSRILKVQKSNEVGHVLAQNSKLFFNGRIGRIFDKLPDVIIP